LWLTDWSERVSEPTDGAFAKVMPLNESEIVWHLTDKFEERTIRLKDKTTRNSATPILLDSEGDMLYQQALLLCEYFKIHAASLRKILIEQVMQHSRTTMISHELSR
jgi:hypothetical protein